MLKKRAQSSIEYMIVIIFVIGAILVFQKYIARAISGRWKTVGDSFGSGRQFDPRRTTECGYDSKYTLQWYDALCYEDRCDMCWSPLLELKDYSSECKSCIEGCESDPNLSTICNH